MEKFGMLAMFVLCMAMISNADQIVSQGLNSAQYTASAEFSGSFVAPNAFDGDPVTQWVAGAVGPQWIEVDLGQERTLSRFVGIATTQTSATQEIYVSDSPIGDTGRSSATLVYTFTGATTSDQIIEQPFMPITGRYVQVYTAASAGWVGWKEVRLYSPDSDRAGQIILKNGLSSYSGQVNVQLQANAWDWAGGYDTPGYIFDGRMFFSHAGGLYEARNLLKFDLQGVQIPQGSVIRTASLALVSRKLQEVANMTIGAFEALQPWAVGATCWTNWGSGGDDAGYIDLTSADGTVLMSLDDPALTAYEILLTPALVQDWIDNSSSNNGVLLMPIGDTSWTTNYLYATEPDVGHFSPTLTITYSETEPVVFTPDCEVISGPTAITLTCNTAGASVYYTTDGSNPTSSSSLYSGPVTVDGGITLKAVAIASDVSPVTGVTYSVPAFDRPEAIDCGTATVDGDLSDWADATWAPLDQVYDISGSTEEALLADVLEASYAARWQTNKIYVAVKVRDASHSFTNDYINWNARDAVEVYVHTDNDDDVTYDKYITAQQYVVGFKASDNTQLWAAIGGNSLAYPQADSTFSGTGLAAGSVVGEWLYYEFELTPYRYLGLEDAGDLSTSVVTQLGTGDMIDLDVCVVGHNGTSYAGMMSENMMTGKSANIDSFGLHVLVGTPLLAGDANMDGAVDVGDLGILAANYGVTSGANWAVGDFNGDGAVDVGDLGILAANYGTGSSSSADFDADYAKVFGEESGDNVVNTESWCGAFGLPLIAGLLLIGLMLVKFEE